MTWYVWITVREEIGNMVRARRLRDVVRMDYIGRRESF